MKKLISLKQNPQGHWVGDGFPVRSVFSYNESGQDLSPFLLMDYAGPHQFEPARAPRGVDEHPHRGFETVTIVYDGEVDHRDSAGGGGHIGPGDVQWMTAASGLVHEEKHGAELTKKGGRFEMVQLWVNLPARFKMTPPKYQGLLDASIPRVELPQDAGQVRVIAGRYGDAQGPASTFTPINLWDLRLKAGSTPRFATPVGHTAALFVMSGSVRLESGEVVGEGQLALLDREGSDFGLSVTADTKALFLGGEPIAEPIVGYGPFVMNTQQEIRQAMLDYQSGKMGRL